MENKIELALKSDCTGCKACSNVCPTNSISFVIDGIHAYPEINHDTCIRCSKCQNVCKPLILKTKSDTITEFLDHDKYYCAWNVDQVERQKATSGGIAGALAKKAIENGWYVSGAAFNSDWYLKHIISNNYSILNKIRGSKYLLSDTQDTYREILRILKTGNHVLFTGTPCQCDALRRIVTSQYKDKLFTCEIICHGVNSPLVWSDYKDYLERKNKSRLTNYNFRSKRNGWGTVGKIKISYVFENGKMKHESQSNNIFHTWFGKHYIMRQSCFKCPYRLKERFSDIVIGDFWGIEKIEPELDVKSGASVLIITSKKGYDFVESCDIIKTEVIPQKAHTVLRGFIDSVPLETKEKQLSASKLFEIDYLNNSFDIMAEELYPIEKPFHRFYRSLLFHLHIIK